MPFLVAVEPDTKCADEIRQSLKEISEELGYELILSPTLEELRAVLKTSEKLNQALLIALIAIEEIKSSNPKDTPADIITALKEELKCDILITSFDDPLKPLKPKNYPVPNIIYKPFDLTILKEQVNFALAPAKKVQTKYVHNAQIESEIEIIKKFKLLELSEFSFKISKDYELKVGEAYKFYHPLFENKKNDNTLMHTWARVLSETDEHYSLFFCQIMPVVLSQIRKRVAASEQKTKHPEWPPPNLSHYAHSEVASLQVAIELTNDDLIENLKGLLDRNFKNISYIDLESSAPVANKSPPQLPTCDLLITATEYDLNAVQARFTGQPPITVRLTDETLDRKTLEKRWMVETLRSDTHIDKAHLVKLISLLFPFVPEGEEAIQRISIQTDEMISLSESVKAHEFSELAITLSSPRPYQIGDLIDLSLPQPDEYDRKEIKAKAHFVDPKKTNEAHQAQFVLFGMRDEVLKELRLWTLQQHIAKQSKGS